MSIKQAIAELEEVERWMESQSKAQSKGGHATFDLMMLREQRDRTTAALAALRSMPHGEPERLALTQATAPRKIWLNLFGDADTGCEPFPDDHEGVTWSDDEPGDFNVPYVRADLATPHTEAVRMSEAEINELAAEVLGYSALHPEEMKLFTECVRAVEQATAARYER